MYAQPMDQTEEEYWNYIKDRKLQIPVNVSENGEINIPYGEDVNDYLKVVCISDTHDRLKEIESLPDGDVLIHAGDFTVYGDMEEIERFNCEMARFPHKHKLVIAGNHELGFDRTEVLDWRPDKYKGHGTEDGWKFLNGVTYLKDTFVEIDGIKFYGSPWHPMPGYPFFRKRHSTLKLRWENIPNDVDVLITHTPPLGYLDVYHETQRQGCRYLLDEVEHRIKPQFHVFGHIHESAGVLRNENTIFINCSQMQKGKVIVPSPKVFFIKKRIPEPNNNDNTFLLDESV